MFCRHCSRLAVIPGMPILSDVLCSDSSTCEGFLLCSMSVVNCGLFTLLLFSHWCPPLCDPMSCSPPGSSVHGISQARVLEWAAIPSSRDLPDPGTEPVSPALAGGFFAAEPPGKPRLFALLGPFRKSWECLPALCNHKCNFPFTSYIT